MQTWAFFALFFIGACYAAEKNKNPFKFENCQKGDSIATINHMSFSPDPVSLSKNITATVSVDLHEDVPEGAIVKMMIYKVTSLFGVKLPAPCFNGIGSCTLVYCKVLDIYKHQACPFFPADQPCECPLKKNTYGGTDITIPIPDLGPLLKFIASGLYRVEAKLVHPTTKKQLACFIFTGKALP